MWHRAQRVLPDEIVVRLQTLLTLHEDIVVELKRVVRAYLQTIRAE